MNEIIDDATLAENGYIWDEEGGYLTTSSGEYLESVTIGSKTMPSSVGIEDYNRTIEQRAILEQEGFQYDENSSSSRYSQKRTALAEYEFKKYQDNPIETTISRNSLEDGSFQEAFEKDRQKKIEKGEPAYPDVNTMVQGEEGDIFSDLDPEDVPLYKNLIAERKKILTEDPDFDTKAQGYIDETDKELEENSWYNPMNIGLHVSNIIDEVAMTIADTGTGMESEEKKARLLEVEAEISRLHLPFIERTIEENDILLGELERINDAGEYDAVSSLEYSYASNILEGENAKLKESKEGAWFPHEMFNGWNLLNQVLRGLPEVTTQMPFELSTKLAINKHGSENLTPSQRFLSKAFATKTKIEEAQIKQTRVHELLTGLNHSLEFLSFSKLGRSVAKRLTGKVVLKGLPGKITRTLVNVGTQALIIPSTYISATSTYSGPIREVEKEDGSIGFTTDRHTYDSLQEEMDYSLSMIEEQLYQERENEERVEELLLTKEKLEEVKKELKTSEPAGALGSLGHGFIESAKEIFAETYFGPLMGKIFGKTMKSRAGRYLTNSKTGKWLNSSDSALKEVFNRKYGEGVMPGQRLIGSNLEEWGEEVFVQILPTMSTNPQYNQDGSQKTFFEEYKSQLGELLTWDFHTKVVAQTLLMSKGAQSLGWASQNMSKYGGSIPLFNSKETRAKSKQARQTSRNLSKTIKSLGDLNQSSKSFEVNLMGTGEGSFNMSDYNTRIALLKKEGLFVEAGQLERDKIYKQAVAAVNSGKGREFLKSMVKAQYNKNLSPETKSVIKRLETEVNNMLNDNSTYLNSSTIISLKAKNRFAKQTIADIEKAQMESGADMIEINREFEKVGLSFSDIANPNLTETDYENVQEKLTTLKKRLSPEAERHVLLEMLKVESKETVAGFNSAIKDATSNETQVFLAKQKAYSRRVDLINKYRYSSKMTAKEFKDVVAPALLLNSKTDGLSKEAVYDMNDRVYKLMLEDERQALASYRALMDTKEEIVTTPPEAVVTEPNYVENIKETVEVASAGMQAQAKEAIEENDDSYLSDPDSDAVIQNHDSLDLMLPMDKVDDTTIITLQKWAKEYEKEMDTPPTFEDYWGLIVKTYGDKHVFDKESLEWIAGQWKFAELGSPSWKKIWVENYLDLGSSALASFQGAVTRNDTEEVVIREATESKIESKVKTEPSAGISSSTGSPISLSMGEKTINTGKTTVTSPKGNFSGIKYLNVETTEGDTVYHKKEDIDSEIPVLNEESHLDIKELLHKNKNQPGDILDIRVSDERDWDNPKILVSVGDPVSGKATKYITFADWIIANQPKEMSLEEFKKTEKFISKVPMFYVGSNGKDVMHIPDTDWYNALNLLDKTTQEGSDDVVGEVDIDNPSPQLLSDINQGKENTLKLRQQILNGDVTKGEIESKDGSIWVNIPKEDAQGNKIPPKKLGEVAKDNPIVLFNGVNFVNLDNKVVAGEVVISNKKYAEDYYKKAKGSSYQTYYLSPTHKKDNKQYYVAIGVLRKNENEENQAHSEDVQSAKWILAAQNVLASGKPKYKMTIEQAQGIRKQIIKETGVDIRPLNNARDLVNSMIAIQDPTSKRVYSAYDMDVPSPKKERDSKGVVTTTTKLGPFMDGLFFGSYTPIQNTGLKKKKSHGLSVVKKEEKFQVSRIGENYTEYLQERLSTNFMSYNMGTEKDPAFTISVQPIIKMNPILKEGKVESTQEKENTQPEVKIEVTETKEESNKLTTEELTVLKESEDILKEYNSLNEIESEEDQMLPVMGDVNIIQESLKTIGGLSSKSQREVISNLISTIISNFDPTVTSSIGEHYDKVENSFKEVYQSKLGKLNTVIDKIEELAEKFPEDKGIRHRLSNLRATKSNVSVVTENYKDFFVSAFAEAQKRGLVVSNSDTSLKEELAQELDDHITGEMYAKDLYKSANETVHKDKIGIKLKRIFSGIYTGDTGFLGTPLPANPDTIYNYVATLLSSPLPTDPSFEAMVERLEIIKDSVPWISPLIKKLREADQNTRNGFVSNMYKYSINSKFVNFSFGKDGTDSGIWNTNSNSVKYKIRDSWNENFKRSSIVEEDYLNPSGLKKLKEQYESWGDDKHEASEIEQREWLAEFGIVLEDASWKELRAGNLLVGSAGNRAQRMPFTELFMSRAKGRSKELFDSLYKFAEKNMNKKKADLDYTKNASLVPFKDMNNIMNGLLAIESTHNTKAKNITMRDGGKNVSEMVFPGFFVEAINKLTRSADTDKKYLEELQQISFSSNSLLLELLINEPEMADIFSYGEVSLTSMKNEYKSAPSFSNIDELSSVDYIFHQRQMFQDMKTEKLDVSSDGFQMRVATMSTPTNSDKGRMMLVKTGVYDFFGTDLALDRENGLAFTEELKELLYKRLILPELSRTMNPVENNIKNYDKGAGRFNVFPIINTLKNKEGVSVREFLKQEVGNATLEQDFKNSFFSDILFEVEAQMKKEALDILSEESEFNINNKNKTNIFNNKTYISRENYAEEQDSKAAVLDYVINSNIHNMNMMQTITGDSALYFNSKLDPLSSDPATQKQISIDLGINMGKRMALMIAPGVVLAESQDEQYIQIALEDNSVVAPNIEEIIGWHYGKSALKEVSMSGGKTYQTILDEYRNNKASEAEIKQLQLRFKAVKGFFDIENTDAQEYTTLREHLRVLQGYDKISKEKADQIIEQVYVQKKPLSKEELGVVLSPMKPVAAGEVIERDNEGTPTIRRVVYIKSSSFPLIPGLVGESSPLFGLMNKMEEIEGKMGKGVRASYQSANKVGSLKGSNEGGVSIDPLKPDDLERLDIVNDNNKGSSPLHSLLLNRRDFKIQQEVPYKSDKIGTDKVSMGTQIFKLLFGDGISDINVKDFNGRKLQEEFFEVFSEMIGIQRGEIIKELGLNEDYTPIDKEESMKRLQKFLLAEAQERDFSENDIKSFGLVSTGNGKDKIYHFKQELWLSGNSNKIEAMLNAIINNKIFKQKLPGNAFVVGSNNGITLVNQEDAKLSQVVYLGDYKGGELQGTEVLAPSKVKIDGKIVDLFEVREGKHTYLIEGEDGSFTLNEEVIDPELFDNFTFRTPTSSHGSGSTIKIVGFIPAILGDLMITPSNFVTQMGQDFDVDKLTAYQYHHIKNKEGKIVRLREEDVANIIAEAESKYSRVKEEYETLKRTSGSSNRINSAINELDILLGGVFLEEEVSLEKKLNKLKDRVESLPKQLRLKILQNRFIEIHNEVYKSDLPEIQRKINKVLSMEVAEKQAEGISKLSSFEQSSVNLLSPTYQMNKMISGSTGSSSIAIYAKAVTFNSLAQQMEKKMFLTTQEGGRRIITIGNLKSDGQFGRTKNITRIVKGKAVTPIEQELSRDISESLDERVNTGTDNEKAQVLGRVGITHTKNIAVDSLLAALGLDLEVAQYKDEKEYLENGGENNPFNDQKIINGEVVYYIEHSIPYLLHSQPIIKEFFKRLKNSNSNIGEFTKNAEEKIKEKLLMGYVPGTKVENSDLTGENLKGALSESISTDFQKQVLTLYAGLMEDAANYKDLNEIVDLSNLGKSMWEAKDKIEKFRLFIKGESDVNKNFSGATRLLGTHNREGRGLYLGEGDYFEPTTNQGVMVGTALSLARNAFFDYYPYYNHYITTKVKRITDSINTGKVKVADQEFIFQEAKKFLTSSNKNGVYQGDTKQERDTLFMDKEDNTSLSTYINGILSSKEETEGVILIKNNPLLSSMAYTKGINGEPSLIKFDNNNRGDTLEEDYHIAMKELLSSEGQLPNLNGKPFTTRMLAQALVEYSYLSGGIISQAIEFHKYIPIEYYDQVSVPVTNSNGKVVEASITRLLQQYNPSVSSWSMNGKLEGFITQFFQNNPRFGRRLEKKEYVKEGGGIALTDPDRIEVPEFVSIPVSTKKKGKRNKWQLFQNVVGTSTYTELEVVGTFGMSEYIQGVDKVESVIEGDSPKVTVSVQGQVAEKPTEKTPFVVKTGDSVTDLLKKVENDSQAINPAMSEVANTLLRLFGDKAMETQVEVDNTMTPQGAYGGKVIKINSEKEDKAQTFIHEFVHSVTADFLTPYLDINGQIIKDENLPEEVIELNEVFEETRKEIRSKYKKEFDVFEDRYNKYVAGDKTIVFSPREVSLFYPTINIKEYLAVSLSNNDIFLGETSKIKYKGTSLTISKKFEKVIQRLFNLIAGVDNNLASEIVKMNLQFLEKRANQDYEKLDLSSSKADTDWAVYQTMLSDPFLDTPPDIGETELGNPENDTPTSESTDLMPPATIEYTESRVDQIMLSNNIKPCKR